MSSEKPLFWIAVPPVSDRQVLALEEQVRAVLRKTVSDPRGISVTARHDVVVLTGRVLRHEEDGLLKATFAVPGVKEIINQLQSHDEQGDVPPVRAVRLGVRVQQRI